MILSIVIPAYNESDSIRHTIAQLRESIYQTPQIIDHEIIVVDDHSPEPLSIILRQEADPKIRCLRLSRRSGSHTALRAGLSVSTGDAVLCISADGQEDPMVISQMIEQWKQGNQIVWGLRRKREKEGFLYQAFTRAFYKLLALLTERKDCTIDLNRADFYLLDRQVVNELNRLSENYTSLFGLIAWIGYEQAAVEYVRRERLFGHSKWRFRARLRLAKDWIIAFSGLPLKSLVIVGFSIAGLGFFFAVFTAIRTLVIGNPISGWSSLMIVILILGGFQLLTLGIIGEYLWRTLEETRRRPIYFIENDDYSTTSSIASNEAK
jgi:glycosyltransferase involved in cell wall biosynthesis